MDKDNDDDFSLSSYYENNVASAWGGYHTENQFDVLRDDYEAPSNSRYEPKHDNIRNGRTKSPKASSSSRSLGESYNPNNVRVWDGRSRDCHGNPCEPVIKFPVDLNNAVKEILNESLNNSLPKMLVPESPMYDPKRSFGDQWSERCQKNPGRCAKEVVGLANAVMGNDAYDGIGYGMSKGFEYLASFFWTREKVEAQKADKEAKDEQEMKAKEEAEKKSAEDKKAMEDVNTVMSMAYKGVALIFSSKHNYSPTASPISSPIIRPLKGGWSPISSPKSSPIIKPRGCEQIANSPVRETTLIRGWAPMSPVNNDCGIKDSHKFVSNPSSPTRSSDKDDKCKLM